MLIDVLMLMLILIDALMLIDMLISDTVVGIGEGTNVGSFVRGEMVGDPAGTAGQNSGHALDISAC